MKVHPKFFRYVTGRTSYGSGGDRHCKMGVVSGNFSLGTVLLSIAAVVGATNGSAYASDAEGEYHGYFRFGSGSNRGSDSSRGSQACFGLEGVAKYRLGNECDFDAEVGYTREFAKSAGGTSFVGTAMVAAYNPEPGIGDSTLRMSQAFVEAKNVGFLKGGTAWIGRRYYNRPDVHVIDFKYVVMDGTGAGIDAIPVGPGKFSYGVFRNDIDMPQSATRHSFIYQDVPVNRNGTLKFDATIIRADSSVANGHGGWALSVTHKQDKVFGGDNTLALQYGVGPGMKIGGTGDITLGSDFTRTRIVDQLIWRVNPAFTGSANLVVQRDKGPVGTQTWTSFGVRPVVALHEHFKLQLDIGHDRINPADGGPIQQLTKITLAPTLSAGKDFTSRPELRAFVTYARWNRAAQAAATPDTPLSSSGVFGGSRQGISIGVQIESWF
jgi:maltoporin